MKHVLFISLVALFFSSCAAPEADPNIGEAIGRCVYVNGFSDRSECKEYFGSSWTEEAIVDNCAAPVPGSDPGLFEPGLSCEREEILGECFVDPGTVEAATIVFPGIEGDSCSGLSMGCGFAGGEFVPAAACGGEDPDFEPSPGGPSVPFTPFQQVCVDPIDGKPPGNGPDGQVCTWEAISGATEEGRKYADYAGCEPVLTQRPYWAVSVEADTPDDDPRYSDEEWLEEYEWATQQVESTACVCCHAAEHAPDTGPSDWHVDAAGIWTDTLDDDGLAVMAGWIDSRAFGAFSPEHNNGFSRLLTGIPTTNPARMQQFLVGELERRGLTRGDFSEEEPFGGPLADQLVFEPQECVSGNGVDADGLVTWSGGPVRYLYILEGDADSPGVPPKLDLPEGTVWKFDVPPQATPVSSGVVYGEAPEQAFQSWPVKSVAAPLVPGQTYYLYALMDIALPLTRCLFIAQ